ncbi:41123_t:CDS:2, partial [Gigaspora margarita]
MQAVDALLVAQNWSVTSGDGLAKKWSSNISKGHVSISSKACAKSVQFVRRSTGMGKKGIGFVNKIYSDRVFGELVDSILTGKVFWLDNRYSEGTGYGSKEQGSRGKRVDIRVGFVAYNRRKGSGDNNCTQVGLSSMVADATPYPGQLYSSVSSSDIIHKGFLRGGGTVKEPKLAVPSSKS